MDKEQVDKYRLTKQLLTYDWRQIVLENPQYFSPQERMEAAASLKQEWISYVHGRRAIKNISGVTIGNDSGNSLSLNLQK